MGKCFVDTLGNIFRLNFLGYEHCFMSIRISQLKYHYISVDYTSYAIYVAESIYILPPKTKLKFS